MISVVDLYGKELNVGDRVVWFERGRGMKPGQDRSGIVQKITYGYQRYHGGDAPIRCTVTVKAIAKDISYWSSIRTFVLKAQCVKNSEITTFKSWSLVNMTEADKLASTAS